MTGIEFDKALRTKDHLKSRSPAGPGGATGSTGPAGIGLVDITWAAAVALAIGAGVTPGVFYRVTDRFNMFLQGIATTEFSTKGILTVLAGTYTNINDEVISLDYDLPNDIVNRYKDLRGNDITLPATPWASFITPAGGYLAVSNFGNTNIFLNTGLVYADMTGFTGNSFYNIMSNYYAPTGAGTLNYITMTGLSNLFGDMGFIQDIVLNDSTLFGLPGNTVSVTNGRASGSSNILVGGTGSFGTFTLEDNSTATINGGSAVKVNLSSAAGLVMNDGTFFYENLVGGSHTSNGAGNFIVGNDEWHCNLNTTNCFIADCRFAHSSMTLVNNNLTEVDISFYNGTIPAGYVANFKRYSLGFSNFEVTIDLAGSTQLDLTGYNFIGIVNVTDTTTATPIINTIVTGNTNNKIEARIVTGKTCTINPTAIAGIGANQIAFEFPGIPTAFNGTNGDWFEFRKIPGETFVRQTGGAIYA